MILSFDLRWRCGHEKNYCVMSNVRKSAWKQAYLFGDSNLGISLDLISVKHQMKAPFPTDQANTIYRAISKRNIVSVKMSRLSHQEKLNETGKFIRFEKRSWDPRRAVLISANSFPTRLTILADPYVEDNSRKRKISTPHMSYLYTPIFILFRSRQGLLKLSIQTAKTIFWNFETKNCCATF